MTKDQIENVQEDKPIKLHRGVAFGKKVSTTLNTIEEFTRILNLYTEGHYGLQLTQLPNGEAAIFSSKRVWVTFSYYGGTCVRNITFYTPQHIHNGTTTIIWLNDSFGPGAAAIQPILDAILPHASTCTATSRYGVQLSLIETALKDPTSQIEVTNYTDISYDCVIDNPVAWFKCSFRYFYKRGRIRYLYMKTDPKLPPFRHDDFITISVRRRWLFDELPWRTDLQDIDRS